MRLLKRLRTVFAVHLPILVKSELLRRFPSLWGRVRLRPTAAWLNPTDNCNMRCIMCNQWRETKTDELTTAEWKDLLRQLREVGIDKVGFNGGEPLLRKDIVELIAEVSRLGMTPALITSGFLLDEKKLEDLIAAGLKHVTVSIDGVGDEYEKIRRREWPRVEAAARRVAEAYRAGRLDANIGFVVMKQTLGHLERVRAFTKELGLPLMISLVDSTPFFFKIPENQRGEQSGTWVDPESYPAMRAVQKALVDIKRESHHGVINTYADIAYMASYFADPLQKDIPCTVSALRVMINSHGEVYGGCWSMGSWGCVRKQPLREILASERYLRAHKAMFYKKCPGCSCGYTTNVRYSLPLQVRDRLFNLFPGLRRRIYAGGASANGRRADRAVPAAS